jgi:hypothetical protein
MKRLLAALALLLAAACASLVGPREVDVPLSRLQEGMERRFPYTQRYLGLFDVSAVNPRLAMRPEENRIAATLDLSVRPVLVLGRGLGGTLTLSGVPRVDMARGVLLLAEPRVDALRLPGLDQAFGGQLANIASFLAAQLLGDLPVHAFAPGELRYAGVQFAPQKIVTQADRLVVTFAPVK